MGQEKSRHVYSNASHEDELPVEGRILNENTFEEIALGKEDEKKEGSDSVRSREHVPLLDLRFSSKRSSRSSGSSTTSDDSFRDDAFRSVLEPLYEKTVGYYRERSEKGDAFGEYYVALAYENGFGGYPKDLKEARDWYLKSSEKAFILAEHAYQRLSTGGEEAGQKTVGVAARVGLLLRAAMQGHKQAVVRLRLLCDKDKDVVTFLKTKRSQLERKVAMGTDDNSFSDSLVTLAFLTVFLETSKDSYDDVIELFKKSADSGNNDASYALGKLYRYGAGKALAPNQPLAIKYLTEAADHGQLMAQIELGKCFLAKSEGHVGNEKFEAKAYRYFKQAADNGSAEGWLNIAHQYLYGEVIENDVSQAVECLERAAVTVDYTDSGRTNSRALCVLGRIYRYGISEISTDFQKATGYFTNSAHKKFPNACLELGKMYARGKGVEQDVSRGKALLESVHTFSESQYQLGRLYDVLKDEETAEQYYRQAMKGYSRDVAKHHDYTIGLYRIAKMHEYGRGTPMDPMKAKAFYYRATTSAEKTYILWWKGCGEKALRRLTNLKVPETNGTSENA